jgi:hypothetical protein
VQVCSVADQSRERENVIRRFGQAWRRRIEGERRRVIAEAVPDGAEHAEAELGPIDFTVMFFIPCEAGVVVARYEWQVRTNVHGRPRVVSVPRGKKFSCGKIGGVWICG